MYTHRVFNNSVEFVDYMNGGIVGAPLSEKTYNLDTKTLLINDAVADRTVTFVDTSNAGLSPLDILTQIRAAHANLINVVLRNYGNTVKQPQLVLAKIGYSVKLGTANLAIGWPVVTTIVSEVTPTNVISVAMLNAGGGPRYEVLFHT